MKRVSYFPLLLLIFFLFSILSISKEKTERIRLYAISSFSPFFNIFNVIGAKSSTYQVGSQNNEAMDVLSLENTLLKDQVEGVYEWLTFDQRIQDQFDKLKELKGDVDHLYWKDFFRRRSEELKSILEVQLQALPAKVIFRDPTSWSSSIWINVGEKDNYSLGRLVIAKNSPVVIGDNLIGVVEYVGKKQSRIRLITDSGLVPSVRAVRGRSQDSVILQMAADLFKRINERDDLFESNKTKIIFTSLINDLISRLKEKHVDYFLAKGELHGSSSPLWRSYGQKLKGIGFNYDYKDQEGPARDLKTGNVLDPNYDFLSHTLLKKGDLLVTTGLDGVFPAGLKVATVSYVKNLIEGDYYYEIEATPTASNLSNLNIVFVLPPLGFEKK